MDAFFGKGLLEKRDRWNRARVHKSRIGSSTRPKAKLTKHRKQIRKQKRANTIIQKRALQKVGVE